MHEAYESGTALVVVDAQDVRGPAERAAATAFPWRS
jgi:hypothetical protein